jgi:demethylmenaquinone methyltransferase/2-methoxy-6-polyprenyl-1,4-benzoquinol methylase
VTGEIEQLPNAERAVAVRTMFGSIASGYDRTNSLLSGGVHHLWRRAAIKALKLQPGQRILDCCTGTGDLAFAEAKALREGEVVGTDFTPEMIELAKVKAVGKPGAATDFSVADATKLPFEDDVFDAATVSFGIRNVVEPIDGLREMTRVVKPGGRVLVLEFGQPTGVFGLGFRVYSRFVMPLLGGLMTGNREAYEYLPRTSAAFPAGDDFVDTLLKPAGLELELAQPLTFGTAWVYVGRVPERSAA